MSLTQVAGCSPPGVWYCLAGGTVQSVCSQKLPKLTHTALQDSHFPCVIGIDVPIVPSHDAALSSLKKEHLRLCM